MVCDNGDLTVTADGIHRLGLAGPGGALEADLEEDPAEDLKVAQDKMAKM